MAFSARKEREDRVRSNSTQKEPKTVIEKPANNDEEKQPKNKMEMLANAHLQRKAQTTKEEEPEVDKIAIEESK